MVSSEEVEGVREQILAASGAAAVEEVIDSEGVEGWEFAEISQVLREPVTENIGFAAWLLTDPDKSDRWAVDPAIAADHYLEQIRRRSSSSNDEATTSSDTAIWSFAYLAYAIPSREQLAVFRWLVGRAKAEELLDIAGMLIPPLDEAENGEWLLRDLAASDARVRQAILLYRNEP